LVGSGTAAGTSDSTKRREVAFARLLSSTSGVVGVYDVVGCGAHCTSYRPHVFLTADTRGWREISPRHLPFQLEDVGFASRRMGWLVANDCVAAKAFVYRTKDGGHTWRAARITSSNCAAGSGISLSFADAKHVWAHTVYANAPGDVLAHSADGGRTWKRVAVDLPVLGAIVFASPRDGWLGHSGLARSLYVTHNGGRSWRRVKIAAPREWHGAKLFSDVPTFFGRHGVLPVSIVRGRREAVAFYVTGDGGRTWRLRKLHRVRYPVRGEVFFANVVPTSVVSPSVWWVVSGRHHPVITVTRDAGKTWHASVLLSVQRADGLQISAGNAHHAWLTVGERSTAFYVTSDGGRTWNRLAPPRN
jgi:photosystem II stability/assembly factor-like uncharacterized protein